MPRIPIVPEHEQEVVRAGIRRTGDPDVVPTTALRGIVLGRTRLWSRHRKAHELAMMAGIVADLPEDLRPFLAGMRCMSDQGRVYVVTLSPWDPGIAREVACEIDRITADLGGHGGIDVRPREGTGREGSIHVDAHWTDDFEVDDGVP